MNFDIPKYDGAPISKVVPEAPPEALNLLNALLQVSPQKRITAQQALQHDYFKVKTIERPLEVFNSMKGHNDHEEGWSMKARYRSGKKCKL